MVVDEEADMAPVKRLATKLLQEALGMGLVHDIARAGDEDPTIRGPRTVKACPTMQGGHALTQHATP